MTLNWCGGTEDMDLHAWNSDGTHAGWRDAAGGVENQIAGGYHYGDSGGASCLGGSEGGFERFTDQLGGSHLITIGVCYASTSESGIAPIPTYVVEVKFLDGTTHKYASPAIGWPPEVTILPLLEAPGEGTLLHTGLPGEYLPPRFCPSP